MIRTEKELSLTRELLLKFKKGLKIRRQKHGKTRPGEMSYLTEQGLIRQINDLEFQIEAYLAINNGKSVPLRRLTDLGAILGTARIANKLTQAQLAKKLKMKQQQIQRYEADDYKGIAIERMDKVVEELGIEFHLS